MYDKNNKEVESMNHRDMFPGGNTSNGFVNYFSGIFPDWENNNRLYILKGGPGVGKNTFMKRIGKIAEDKNYLVEYFHCASDNESLDAVRIPILGLTVVDGTAPHIIDPKYPGAVDQIWNLGVFLNEKELGKRRNDVISCCSENSFYYKLTFSYLHAAGSLSASTYDIYRKAIFYSKIQSHVKDLFSSKSKGNYDGTNHFRHLFYSAITPSGQIDYAPSKPTKSQVLYLDGPTPIASEYLKLAYHMANDNGYHGEIFYSPLLPEEPLHINIQELDLSITTTKPLSASSQSVLLSLFADTELLSIYKENIAFQEEQKNILIDAAIRSLSSSKHIHDNLESIYKECIDFDKVTKYCDERLTEIF